MQSSLSLPGVGIIVLSFLLALLMSILPLPAWLQLIWPQFLLLVLIYWVLAFPYRINLGIAWLLGLLLDVLYGTLLGEHALAFSVVAYLVYRLHRQIRMFPILQQAMCIFLLVLIYQTLLVWIQGILGLLASVFLFWLSALTSMLLWPFLFIILHGCQQRFCSTTDYKDKIFR